MARTKVEGPPEAALVYRVYRRSGCIVVEGDNPPLGDLHALLRQWSDYHEPRMRWSSLKLARLWGAFVVVCESSGDEALLLREADAREAQEGRQGPTGQDG